jgi:hypothetical protein
MRPLRRSFDGEPARLERAGVRNSSASQEGDKEVIVSEPEPASVDCPWCAFQFGSQDRMLDHLQGDHPRHPESGIGVVSASEAGNALGGLGHVPVIRPSKPPRTPVAAMVAIALMALTAAAVLLPGAAPTSGLVLRYVLLAAYALDALAGSHPNFLAPPRGDATPHRPGNSPLT